MDLVSNYRDDKSLREKYYEFIAGVFPGANFRRWQEMGGWSGNYIPFSLYNGLKIVANVSVSEMDIIIEGKALKAIQLGAVGALQAHRNKGLVRRLIEHVIEHYEDNCDLMFLFANGSVLDFYPKFGFRRAGESIFSISLDHNGAEGRARKLELDSEDDRSVLRRLLHTSRPATELFGAEHYGDIALWHIVNTHHGDLWHIEDSDIVVVCRAEDRVLSVYDIFSAGSFSFDRIVAALPEAATAEKALLYFSPDKIDTKAGRAGSYEYSPLFVRGNFPLADGSFKFPVLAQT